MKPQLRELAAAKGAPKNRAAARPLGAVATAASYRYSGGFTVVELMIAVTIMLIVVTFAVPSMSKTIARNRIASQSQDFQAALNLARSEAGKTRTNAIVCPASSSTGGCNTSSFAGGWIVCDDSNGDGACAASEVVRYHAALSNSAVTAKIDVNGVPTTATTITKIQYTPLGAATVTGSPAVSTTDTVAFKFCNTSYSSLTPAQLSLLSASGATDLNLDSAQTCP